MTSHRGTGTRPCGSRFFGLAKVLGVAFCNHLGIMLVLSVVDEVEKEGFCHTVNPNFIIAHIKQLLLRNVSFEHGREHSAAVFLNRHVLLLAWYKMDEVAKVAQHHVWHAPHKVGNTLFSLV